MKNIFRTVKIMMLLVIASFSTKTLAQQGLSQKQLEKHKADYSVKTQSLGMAIKPSFFYEKKIDLNKVEEFKSVGLDLVAMGNKVGEYNFRENSLVSEVIIQGTIVAKTYHPAKNLNFHTTYKIQVDSYIKGSGASYIYVKTVSGAIGEDMFVNRSSEPKLYMGERVLMMLSKVDIAGYTQARAEGHFDKELNATSEDYVINGKYSLKANSYFDSDREFIGKLEDVSATISKIVSINDDSNFYSKKF